MCANFTLSRRRGIGRTKIVVAAVIIVLIVAAVAFVTLTSQSFTPMNRGTSSASSSNTSSAAAVGSVSNSSGGLELSLQARPSGNGTYTITAEEVNLLRSMDNVTAADQWKYPAGLLDPFNNCAPGVDPVGFAIFQGNYEMNNYTTGKALSLYNTTIDDSCTVDSHPNQYLFQPLGDNISVYNDGHFRTNGTAVASLSTDGYWTGGQHTSAPAMFHDFGPGVYTVLGADTWGHVLLLHFSVTTART
jgi:hypothetical protein